MMWFSSMFMFSMGKRRRGKEILKDNLGIWEEGHWLEGDCQIWGWEGGLTSEEGRYE